MLVRVVVHVAVAAMLSQLQNKKKDFTNVFSFFPHRLDLGASTARDFLPHHAGRCH
jgi:hypothetical protein